MSQKNARTFSFRTKDTLICLQNVICAEENAGFHRVFMFPTIVRHDLHAKPSRFNLAVMSILVRFLRRRR